MKLTPHKYAVFVATLFDASTCKDLKAPGFLRHGTLPLTALHSFPGSGNTWSRVLLSSLTGQCVV